MTEGPPIVEPTKIPMPSPLPKHFQIASFAPAPAGWFAYYIDEEARRVLVVSIVVWAVVEYFPTKSRASPEVQELRHFTATSTGTMVDLLDLPYTLICVLGPSTGDHVATVGQHLTQAGVEIPGYAPKPNEN